jgi:hypothetical protein
MQEGTGGGGAAAGGKKVSRSAPCESGLPVLMVPKVPGTASCEPEVPVLVDNKDAGTASCEPEVLILVHSKILFGPPPQVSPALSPMSEPLAWQPPMRQAPDSLPCSVEKSHADDAALAFLDSYLRCAGPLPHGVPSLEGLNQRVERCECLTCGKPLSICAKSSGCGMSHSPGCESRPNLMLTGVGVSPSQSTAPVERRASSLPMRPSKLFMPNSSRVSIW